MSEIFTDQELQDIYSAKVGECPNCKEKSFKFCSLSNEPDFICDNCGFNGDYHELQGKNKEELVKKHLQKLKEDTDRATKTLRRLKSKSKVLL